VLTRLWRFLVGEPEVSERALLLEAIRSLREQSADQNRTFQQWLGMFSAQAGKSTAGWVADDESVAIKEMAQARNLKVPEELLTGTEQDRINWLSQQMDETW
jgi:hypothetical protein